VNLCFWCACVMIESTRSETVDSTECRCDKRPIGHDTKSGSGLRLGGRALIPQTLIECLEEMHEGKYF